MEIETIHIQLIFYLPADMAWISPRFGSFVLPFSSFRLKRISLILSNLMLIQEGRISGLI